MNSMDRAIVLARKVVRRLNWKGLFWEYGKHDMPIVIIAGYTRSGTTYLGRLLANILKCRPIHEPLNPAKVRDVSFFNGRESMSVIKNDQLYQLALKQVFGPGMSGSAYTNTGTRLFYHGRLIKIVRGNHYLDYLAELFPDQKFVFIMRNPCACIASRLKAGWPIPDYSHCYADIAPHLSNKQRDLYENTESKTARLAVSWCLDNYMALRNGRNQQFYFVHYEDLVLDPISQLEGIFGHIRRNAPRARIERELNLESGHDNPWNYLTDWKEYLSQEEQARIWEIAGVFGLRKYYIPHTGLPTGDPPFRRTPIAALES